MIQTIRDAEAKIWTIQKDTTYFKTKINELENQIFDLKNQVEEFKKVSIVGVSSNSGENDSIMNSDGTSITHRLFHIFNRIKVNFLDGLDTLTVNTLNALTKIVSPLAELNEILTYKLRFLKSGEPAHRWTVDTITNPSGYADLRFTDPNNAEYMRYVKQDSSGFYPYNLYTTHLLPNGGYYLGNTDHKWAALYVSGIDTGNLTINGGVVVMQGGAPYFGLSEDGYVVASITPTTATLNYKDHAGNNQSMTVVTSVGKTDRYLRFAQGIRG